MLRSIGIPASYLGLTMKKQDLIEPNQTCMIQIATVSIHRERCCSKELVCNRALWDVR